MFELLVKTCPAQRSISLIFDENPEVANYAFECYSRAKKHFDAQESDYIATITFANDEGHPPLQAADFFAYE